jgi:ribosomal protein S18 acetylase RimI-like enzyme
MSTSISTAEVIDWIYADVDPATLGELHRDLESGVLRSRTTIGVSRTAGSIDAACHIECHQTNTARLQGYRFVNGSLPHLWSAMQSACRQLPAAQVEHLQVAIPFYDKCAIRDFRELGFTPKAELKQLWRTVDSGDKTSEATFEQPFALLCASRFKEAQLRDLLAATLVGSLDLVDSACSSLQCRLAELYSTLELGLPNRKTAIEVLALHERPVALVAMQHSDRMSDLIYLGVDKDHRRQRLGFQLLRHAINTTACREIPYLVTAVDANNLPALRLYARCRFHEHSSFALLERSLS